MNLLKPDIGLIVWQLVSVALLILIVVVLIKFTVVLFKANKAIDELRAYMRRRS